MSRADSIVSPTHRSRRVMMLVTAGACVVVLVLAGVLPSYALFVATSITVAMISLLGLGVVSGSAGMIALCQLSFAAIGAWVMEFLMLRTPLGAALGPAAFLVCMILGAAAAGVAGILVGLPALRLRGVNLAVVTLGLSAATDMTLQKVYFPDAWTSVRAPRPFGLDYSEGGDRLYFLFAAAVTIAVSIALVAVHRGRTGSGWRFVAFSERGTAAAGVRVPGSKLSAFATSAVLGGIAGGLAVGQIGQVNSVTFQTAASLGLYVLSVVVGARLIDMALFGALLFVLIPEALKQLGIPLEWANIVFGVLGVHALMTRSNLGERVREWWYRRTDAARAVTASSTAATAETVRRPADPAAPVLLEVAGLSVSYGELVALAGVDLVIREGDAVGLIGPNGAGKSTFIDAVTGFVSSARGRVVLAGESIADLGPDRRARAGLRRTFQQDRVPPTLTVGQYAAMFTTDAAASREALDYFGCPADITPLAFVDVGTRRLIEVAVNVAAKPRVLLLDEPAAGLSHDEHEALGRRLRDVPALFGTALLIIEHDLDLVRAACTSAVVLNFGSVLARGEVEAVLSDPAVLSAYMGERNV